MKNYYVYILTNRKVTIFYIGVTNNLEKRVYEHQEKIVDSFTKDYKLNTLVYFEKFHDVNEAIKREKQLKNWHRQWKIDLIKEKNPTFRDLLKSDPESSSG